MIFTKKLIFVFLIAFSICLFADDRQEPIDVILALDKSLSMVEEIQAVKDYVNGEIIDKLLQPEDYLLVIAFFGKTDIPVSIKIQGPEDKLRAKTEVDRLLADGQFTDIGNALDTLWQKVKESTDANRKKYLLLITDGIQEAPFESRYYSPDGKFTHALLENTKTIEKQGWKIQILGIGRFEGGRQLAQALSGTYTELSPTPSAGEIAAKTQDFLARIDLSEAPSLSPIDSLGRGTLVLKLRSRGTGETRRISLGGVTLSLPGGAEENILRQNTIIEIRPDVREEARIPIRMASRLKSGSYSGSLRFHFTTSEQFTPVVMDVNYRVKSFLESFWYLVFPAAAVLAFLVWLAGRAVADLSPAKKIRFRLAIESRKGQAPKDVFRLKEGRSLYLYESEGRVGISTTRTPQSISRLSAFSKGLRMSVLKPNSFSKLVEVPQNVLDFGFKVRTEDGKVIPVRLESITRKNA